MLQSGVTAIHRRLCSFFYYFSLFFPTYLIYPRHVRFICCADYKISVLVWFYDANNERERESYGLLLSATFYSGKARRVKRSTIYFGNVIISCRAFTTYRHNIIKSNKLGKGGAVMQLLWLLRAATESLSPSLAVCWIQTDWIRWAWWRTWYWKKSPVNFCCICYFLDESKF